MMRRLFGSAFIALVLTAPALIAQNRSSAPPRVSPLLKLAEPWPEDDVLAARKGEALARKLFQDGPPFEFSLASDFSALNKERSPNNSKQFPGTITLDGKDIAVTLASRGHFR